MSQLQVTGEAKIRDIQGPVVANSGVITALDGAANQYVRGDGTLAIFPTSSGGGSSVSYYLNGSVNQGTFGGSTYYQMSRNAIVGTGTNFSTSANGLIAQFITDANDPDVVSIPSGNWNVEFFMSVSASSGALASFYVEIYKYNGSTFTLLATNVATPEQLTNTTTVDAYFTSVAMPLSAMAVTDRLAVRIFANVASKTVTLYTEDNRLCQIVTTFSKGMLSMNNLTDQSQYLTTGTSGTNFNIVSTGDTHTFNLPVASATNTGKLSSTDWSTFNGKVPYTGANANVDLGSFELNAILVKAITLEAKLNGTASGNLVLRTGTNGYGFGNNAFSLASSPDYDNTLLLISNKSAVTKTALFNINSLTADRTYTFPDVSGTIALLEGTQTFTGVKTFSENPIINGTGTNSAYTILQSAGTNKWRIGNNYAAGVNTFDIFAYDNSSTPLSINSNGAMTLSANVTTTGAQFVQNGFYLTNANGGYLAGYTLMYGKDDGINFALRNGTGGASFIFPSANSYAYTFPAATGTLALTSNLSSYLPLTGGTLTGALNGTSATFTNTSTFRATGNAYTNGSIILQSSSGATSTYLTNSGGIFYLSNNGSTDHLQIASTGAATFSSSVTATSLTLSSASTPLLQIIDTTNSKSLLFGADDNNTFIRSSSSTPIFLQVNGGDTALTLASNQAATFSSSVTSSDTIQTNKAGGLAYRAYFGSGNNRPLDINIDAANGDAQLTWNTTYNGGWKYFLNNFAARIASGNGLTFSVAASGTAGNTISWVDAMTINSTGNVGIGTSSPTANLQISGLSGLPATSGSAQRGALRIANSSNIAFDFGTVAAGQAWLQVSDANNYASNFALLLNPNGGNVGIGTSSPNTYRLYVANNGSPVAAFDSTDVNGGYITYKRDGTDQLYIGSSSALGGGAGFIDYYATSGLGLRFYTNAAERMRITSGGYIVTSAVTYGNTSGGAANMFLFGAGDYGIGRSVSSAKYKTQIEDVEESFVSNIYKMRPIWYRSICERDRKDWSHFGFVAEEIAEIEPRLVHWDKDEEGNLVAEGVQYDRITVLLVAEMQKMRSEIQEQQTQIEELSNKIVALESK